MKFLQAMMFTVLTLAAAACCVAILLAPYVTWMLYGLSFQFIGATIFFVFVLLVAATSW